MVQVYTECIINKCTEYETIQNNIDELFNKYNLKFQDNLYYDYTRVVSAYTAVKNMNLPKGVKTDKVKLDLESCNEEFKMSIVNSKFRKFELV